MEENKNEVKSNAPNVKTSNVKTFAGKASNAKAGQKHKSLLASYLNLKVMLVTFDGRTLIGTMRGCDQVCNVVLDKTFERIFTAGEKPKQVDLGLFVVRGDNVAVVGEVDEEKEVATNWDAVTVHPLQPFAH